MRAALKRPAYARSRADAPPASDWHALDGLATAVLLLDDARRVVHANPAAENLFEVSRAKRMETARLLRCPAKRPTLKSIASASRGCGRPYRCTSATSRRCARNSRRRADLPDTGFGVDTGGGLPCAPR